MKELIIGQALNFGWDSFKDKSSFFVTLFFIILVAGVITVAISQNVLLVLLAIGFWLNFFLGYIKITLDISRGKEVNYKHLFTSWPLVLKYIGASFLYGLAVFVGLLLLVIPGMVLAIRLRFYPYFIVDHGMGPIDALGASFDLSNSVVIDLFLFDSAKIGVNSLSATLIAITNFLLGEGSLIFSLTMFISIPVTTVATAFVYRKLMAQTEEFTSQINYNIWNKPLTNSFNPDTIVGKTIEC